VCCLAASCLCRSVSISVWGLAADRRVKHWITSGCNWDMQVSSWHTCLPQAAAGSRSYAQLTDWPDTSLQHKNSHTASHQQHCCTPAPTAAQHMRVWVFVRPSCTSSLGLTGAQTRHMPQKQQPTRQHQQHTQPSLSQQQHALACTQPAQPPNRPQNPQQLRFDAHSN
jgi:hypothetical protein